MKKKDIYDDTSRYIPTSCAVCDSCFLWINQRTGQPGGCIFGGPFRGYVQTEEQTGTGRTVPESEEAGKGISSETSEGSNSNL